MCCGLTLSRNCKPLPFLARKWSIRVSNSPTSLCAYTQPLQPPRALPRLFRARHMRACVPPRAWRTRPVRIPYMTFVSTHRQSIPLACSSRTLPCTRPARDPRAPRAPNAWPNRVHCPPHMRRRSSGKRQCKLQRISYRCISLKSA